MAVRDEETGLLTGESTKPRGAIFTSPTAVIFAVVLVCGAFVGGSVATGRTASALGNPDLTAVPEADNHEHMTDEESQKVIDDLTGPIEESLKSFLAPFKDMSTSDLLGRVVDNVNSLIKSDEDKYKKSLNIVAEELDLHGLNSDKLAAAVKELEGKPDPEWMNAAGARKLLGGDDKGENVMDMAGNLAHALKTDVDTIMDLFPKMGAGAGKLVGDLQAKGENLTDKEKLMESAMCLAAVSARAAPEPFGKGVDTVFMTTWSSNLVVLGHIDVDELMAAFN